MINILSHRVVLRKFFLDIVFEWEDVLASCLNARIRNNWGAIWKVSAAINILVPWLWNVIQFRSLYLSFVLEPYRWDFNVVGKRNAIPVLIDFWIKDDQKLLEFYQRYAGSRMVLVSSREVYCFLKRKNCPLNIRHWALSLPDKYAITPETLFVKEYDCVLVGRPNPYFLKWIKQYAAKHPDFTYVYNDRKHKMPNSYVDSTGKVLGDVVRTRADYFALLRKSKIGLYSTPAMDGGRLDANGYNQVTPRFLEYLACGCHVLARYPDNEDTNWYDLQAIAKRINSYEEFEHAVDEAREKPVDMKLYSDYLAKHYTSVRAHELEELLKELA